MAPRMMESLTNHNSLTPKRLRVCFSYAAYAKNLIRHLHSSNIPVESGLSRAEFSAVETYFGFTFPPDLRSILQEGLPVGPSFPNWRSSSKQQLNILINLPIMGICKQVSKNGLWIEDWGDRPKDVERALKLASGFLKKSPILVPIYREFYIPSAPCMAGNPVFYVHGGDVRLWSFDICGFFQRFEFRLSEIIFRRPRLSDFFSAPPWAATEARRIEFWTEMAEREDNAPARGDTRGWWSGELGGCLEEVCWRLRDGGWKEEDVREMMMMDGCDGINHGESGCYEPLDKGCLEWRVKVMSGRLLRAGWSTEDVAESLGCAVDCDRDDVVADDEESWFDFRSITRCDCKKRNAHSPFMNLQLERV